MNRHVVYVSRLMDRKNFKSLFINRETMPGQQAQKFHRLMVQGLIGNDVEVDVLSGPPITNQNCSRKMVFLKKCTENGISYRYVPTVNIPIIRNLCQLLFSFIYVCVECLKSDTLVICDVLQGSIAYGSSVACMLFRKPCVGIVTDLPEMLVTGASDKYVTMVNRVLAQCSHYVFLTEYMNVAVNSGKKPYVVIEGISDSEINKKIMAMKTQPSKAGITVCMYAGMLEEKYGVKALVEAFLQAGVETAELHIYGNGSYAPELKDISEHNANIVYHGSVLIEEVEKAELQADLLINPRPSTEEFTKFSFPSKNMEYMASGTPALITRLPGIPDEYYKYVYVFDDESVQGMAETIRTVLSLPRESRRELGRQAQLFVINKKNEIVQAKTLIDALFS